MAVLIGVVVIVVAPVVSAWRLVLLGLLAALVVRQIAKRKVGGQTGDVLGATQQVTEIALLTGCQMMAYGWQAIP